MLNYKEIKKTLHKNGPRPAQNVYSFLIQVYGLGKYKALNWLKEKGWNRKKRVEQLENNQKFIINLEIEKIQKTTKEIEKKTIIKYLYTKNFKEYRIIRGLPVRGQRTKTNAKTAKKLNKQRIIKYIQQGQGPHSN